MFPRNAPTDHVYVGTGNSETFSQHPAELRATLDLSDICLRKHRSLVLLTALRVLRRVYPTDFKPRNTASETTHVANRYPVACRDLLMRSRIGAYSSDLNRRKAGSGAIIAAQRPTFHLPVGHIVSVYAKKKMLWVDATRVIAPVQNMEAYRLYGTFRKNPRQTIRTEVAARSEKSKHAVPTALASPRPGPALIWPFTFIAAMETRPELVKAIAIAEQRIDIHLGPFMALDDRVGSSTANALPPALPTNSTAFTQAA